jgi:hypothetical protein
MSSLDKNVLESAVRISTSNEKRIPDDWEIDWAVSTGRDPEAHLQATQDHQDLVLRTTDPHSGNTCEAIGSANHFQFISRKQVILQALPSTWSGKMMGSMVELDDAIDQLGYLRLSTTERYTRHLGNVLSEEVLQETQEMGLKTEELDGKRTVLQSSSNRRERKRHWLLRIPGGRRFLVAVYNRIFQILYK